MLNRISRRTYGLAGLAIFVAIVLAGCPAAITKPTVAEKLADIASLAVGESQTVDIRGVFKGEKLDYSVRSSAPTIASAQLAENNQSVTIVAVRAGTATITVTAKNDGGSASRSFEVITVPSPTTQPQPQPPQPPPEPPPPEPPSPDDTSTDRDLTIRRGESVEYKLPAGQSLKAPKGDVVSVEPKVGMDNVWIITAHKKGTHAITIFEGAESVGHIVVTVPNSPPTRVQTYDNNGDGDKNEKVPPTLKNPIAEAADSDEAKRFTVAFTGGTPRNDSLKLSSFFEDGDEGDHSSLRYRIANELPDWILLDSKDGFVEFKGADELLLFEVLDKQLKEDRTFTVVLYAVDDSGGESRRSLTIEVTAPSAAEPVKSDYTVRQAPNGNLNRAGILEVGPRIVTGDDWHTLQFNRADGSEGGFRFAFLRANALVKVGDLFTDGTITAQSIIGSGNSTPAGDPVGTFVDGDTLPVWKKKTCTAADTPPNCVTEEDATSVNSDYYLLKYSGDVVAKWNATPALSTDPKIDFRLTGTGGGKITIEYHVWTYTKNTPDVSAGIGGDFAVRAPMSISLDIVTCNSPPNRLSACPGSGLSD